MKSSWAFPVLLGLGACRLDVELARQREHPDNATVTAEAPDPEVSSLPEVATLEDDAAYVPPDPLSGDEDAQAGDLDASIDAPLDAGGSIEPDTGIVATDVGTLPVDAGAGDAADAVRVRWRRDASDVTDARRWPDWPVYGDGGMYLRDGAYFDPSTCDPSASTGVAPGVPIDPSDPCDWYERRFGR